MGGALGWARAPESGSKFAGWCSVFSNGGTTEASAVFAQSLLGAVEVRGRTSSAARLQDTGACSVVSRGRAVRGAGR